ncbi:hypothetical protein OPT61_g3932 [Boeremia exigua]|uniref:Uncharacterized protein n=1 Tax=Boeremia exigua TaxID=749465 RepID=A0ACC2IG93_9PLEO|nr:hypothetical protein OPT61_g3932 [Boeremia exigua]
MASQVDYTTTSGNGGVSELNEPPMMTPGQTNQIKSQRRGSAFRLERGLLLELCSQTKEKLLPKLTTSHEYRSYVLKQHALVARQPFGTRVQTQVELSTTADDAMPRQLSASARGA